MAGRKKQDLNYSMLMSNLHRVKIIELCREPINFTKLKKLTNISSGALTHHLEVLENAGAIIKKPLVVDGKGKRGGEISIQTQAEELDRLKSIERESWLKGTLEDSETPLKSMKPSDRKILKETLEVVNQNKDGLNIEDLQDVFPYGKFPEKEREELLLRLSMITETQPKYFKIKLNQEGIKALKELEKIE